MTATTFAWLVLLCPLVGTIVIALGWRILPGRSAGWLGTLAIALSFAFSVVVFVSMLRHGAHHRQFTSTLWRYDSSAGVDAKLQILVDPLSVFMILVVSGVSALIHLYSVSYLFTDRGYARYFSYLNFFVLSMLLLVLAGNFVLLIVGWAFVGFASYALISFWYRRTTATAAGLKAFVINVVGDAGLVLGTFFVFKHTGTVDFVKVFHAVPHVFATDQGDLVAGCAAVGCATLLMAATIALVQVDLKRVIAYSTISQIGYMIMGVSAGAYSAGLFHLMTHAFFKALLFMAAGSVIGAMAGVQSLDRMRGFRRAVPFTFVTFLVGGLALTGLPPFSGWFSKDDILGFLDHRGGGFEVLGIAGYVGALLTAVYTFRMVFRAFFGPPCEEARELEHGHLAHAEVPRNPMTGEEEDTDVGFPGPGHFIAEREWPMRIAMGALAVLALIGGVAQIPGVDDAVTRFLDPSFADSRFAHAQVPTGPAWVGLIIGAGVAVLGIAIAFRVWLAAPGTAARLQARLAPLHAFLANKWYFDELIDVLVVRPALLIGRFTESVLEPAVIGGFLTGGTTGVVRAGSALVRRAQTGFLRYYAAAMIVSLFGVGLYFLVAAS